MNANQVNYIPPAKYGLYSDVQGFLDDLYTAANEAASSMDASYIDFTSIVKNSIALASSKGVCIKIKGKIHCVKYNNYSQEVDHIQKIFSDGRCSSHNDSYGCSNSDVYCTVYQDGVVSCGTNDGEMECNVTDSNGPHPYCY